MLDACVISMCVISEYAYADYASEGLLQASETNVSAIVRLCLCHSYSVLTICITSSLQNQANPVSSLAISSHAYTGLRLYRLPRQFHLKGTLLYAHRVLYKRRYQG